MDNFFQSCPAKMSDGRFLADYRSANTRDQYIKTINGFVRDDEYRWFLQQNANSIMNKEWEILKEKNSCPTKVCVNQFPTRMTNGMLNEQMQTYNSVASGKLKESDKGFPSCAAWDDYRMSG
jgi:hypothetical protein